MRVSTQALLRLVAAVGLAVAAGLVGPAPAAHAAACTGSGGVTVVVDFNQLGGGVQQVCVPDGGGKTASSLFPTAGFDLRYAARQPGFVCRVRGVPASDPCVNTAPADAFWALWWSTGDGSWKFSNLGAGSLKVPDGGFVAFSWDQSAGDEPPSASAKRAAPPPAAPSKPPKGGNAGAGGNGGGTDAGRGSGTGGGDAPSGSPTTGSETPVTPDGSSGPDGTDGTDGADGTDGPKKRKSKGKRERDRDQQDRKGNQSDDPTPAPATDSGDPGSAADGQVPTSRPPDEGGLPGWVAPGLIGLLFAGAVATYLARRRTSGP